MITYFNHLSDFEFFDEKRLVFVERPQREKPRGSEPPKYREGASEGLEGDIEKQLAELKGGVQPLTPKGYHRERRATRRITEPEPYYPGVDEMVEKALKLGEHMDKKEVLDMQAYHQNLYRQYMNPAFMLYLSQIGKTEAVYPYLDQIMENPEYFQYVNKGDDRIEIKKRKPFSKDMGEDFKSIPKDFLVVMETKEGHITQVGKLNLKKGSDIPWISNEEYNKSMPIFRDRWESDEYRLKYTNYHERIANLPVTEPERTNAWNEWMDSSTEDIGEPLKKLYYIDNILFPQRLIDMVKARNLGFEMEDPQFKEFMKYQKDQGTTYEEITLKKDEKLQVLVIADPNIKGAYAIYNRSGVNRTTPLRVNAEGYILKQREDGSWAPDARYHQAVRRRYYEKYPDAMVDLGEKEKKDLEKTTKLVEDKAKDQEKVAEQMRKKEALREKRKKVDAALKDVKIEKLREVAKEIGKESEDPEKIKERNETIDGLDEATLRAGIKEILDKEEGDENLKKAAKILKVELE